jgi:nitrogen fixation/metabolism regulation signal transduction histidine kinase
MRLSHDRHVFLYAILGGAPASVVALTILWRSDFSFNTQLTLTLLVVGCWFGFAFALHNRVVRPLQTASNLLAALREGDFSVRAHAARHDDPLGELFSEINQLSAVLHEQRLSAREATALLLTVMETIDVAVFAFDASSCLKLTNRAGERLLNSTTDKLLHQSADALGLAECLQGDPVRLLNDKQFPGGSGRWGMRRNSFREKGLPHELVVIADLSQALRAEELKAWQRLVRVIGHELNNSLTPIKSIAGSLSQLFKRPNRAPDWETDMQGGLEIIESRADSLTRFMQAYARLARLPQPVRSPCTVKSIIARVTAMEVRQPVTVLNGEDLLLSCDAAQVEQVLINLVKNATDAALEQRSNGHPDAGVRVGWMQKNRMVEISVEDDGPGIANSGNLFVPFFTTKAEGSGIGLVLSRQIAENHGGTLTIENRQGATGCIASLRLPLDQRPAPVV